MFTSEGPSVKKRLLQSTQNVNAGVGSWNETNRKVVADFPWMVLQNRYLSLSFFPPYPQTFSLWPQKSVASLTIRNLHKPLTTPISTPPPHVKDRGEGIGSSRWAQWGCLAQRDAPAQAPSVAERFANETAWFGLNTGFGLALRILYKILSHSSEVAWHRFTPRLHSVINPTSLRRVFRKGKKKP